MNINYNINHKWLTFPIFQEKMRALDRIILLNVFSMIAHFTIHKGQCQVWKNQISEDYGCDIRKVSKAVTTLEKAGMIKTLKRATKTEGAVVSLTPAWCTRCKEVVHQMHPSSAPRAQINNNKLFKREDAAKASPPFKNNGLPKLTNNKPSWEK